MEITGPITSDSPLRYPGGKGKLSPFIKLIFEANNLSDGEYVEPFAGGAAIAFSLLYSEHASHIHLNDVDRAIYAFWHSVLYRTADLCDLIHKTPLTIREWKRQRAIQYGSHSKSLLKLGFSTLFLNRTNHSGIIKGGVIGGLEQTGTWKIDARFNKPGLIARVQRAARYRDRVSLYCTDAAQFLTRSMKRISPHSLVYLDPPYYFKSNRLYKNFYLPKDHAKLAGLVLTRLPLPWLVSYDNAEPIRALYDGRRSITYGLDYTARSRYEGTEFMAFSDQLFIPKIRHPIYLQAA